MILRYYIAFLIFVVGVSFLFADSQSGRRSFTVEYNGGEYVTYTVPTGDYPIFYSDSRKRNNPLSDLTLSSPASSSFECGHFLKISGTNKGVYLDKIYLEDSGDTENPILLSEDAGYFETIILNSAEETYKSYELTAVDQSGKEIYIGEFSYNYNSDDTNNRPVDVFPEWEDDIIITYPLDFITDVTDRIVITGTNTSDIWTNFYIFAYGYTEFVYPDTKIDKKTGYFECTMEMKEEWLYQAKIMGLPMRKGQGYEQLASFRVNHTPSVKHKDAFDLKDFIFADRTNHTHPWYTNTSWTVNGITLTGYEGPTSRRSAAVYSEMNKYVVFDTEIKTQNAANGYIILRGTNYTHGDPYIGISCYPWDDNDFNAVFGAGDAFSIIGSGYFEIPVFFRAGSMNYKFEVSLSTLSFTEDDIDLITFYVSNTLPTSADDFNYLYHSSDVQSYDWQIYETAQEIIRNKTTDRDKARAIFDYIGKEIEYDDELVDDSCLTVRGFDAVSVLNNRLGVCSGQANLAAALFRAAGLPAKIADGYAYGGSHAWNEVYYNGKWNSIDVTTGYFEIPQRDLGRIYRLEYYSED